MMRKSKYPNGLQEAMERVGKGPTELAEALDTNRQNITRWSAGQRRLTVEWAKRLAPLLNTTPDVLLLVHSDHRRPPSMKMSKVIHVPLLDSITAGKMRAPASHIPTENVPILTFSDLGRGEFFAIRVEDDSMDRIAPEGSTIVVNKADRQLINGKYYVFTLRGEIIFKMWQGGEPAYLAPYSTNSVNKPIFFKRKSDLEVIGRVKRVIVDLS